MDPAIDAFLLGLPALFSIVNPFQGALAFRALTLPLSVQERERLARTVALYSLAVMLIALWAGTFVLGFLGISVAALRVAGGLVIAFSGWQLLATQASEERPIGTNDRSRELAMVPLTIPLTAGPGTISVTIALGSDHPPFDAGELPFFFGMTAAIIVMSVVVWLSYRWADRLSRLGHTFNRTLTRLVGFMLLCIGTQILIIGVVDVLRPLLMR